jgi:hypothetical protein
LSDERLDLLVQVIQRTRTANSLPLLFDDELPGHLDTWASALKDVADGLLLTAWERAFADHDWRERPFLKPGDVLEAAHRVILEDRQRRERDEHYQRRRAVRDLQDEGVKEVTFACEYCHESGYLALMLYCPTWKDWRKTAYPCKCSAAPITQRQPWPGAADWERDRDSGYWQPASPEQSPRCPCLFCKNKAEQR